MAAAFALLVAAVAAAEPAEEKPDRPPRPVKQSAPVFPYNMRLAGLVGEVVVEFIVDIKGHVAEAHVVRSNNPGFERAAIDAVLKWEFEPGMKNGRAVNTRIQLPVVFSLDGGGKDLWSIPPPKSEAKLPPEFMWDVAPKPVATTFPVYPYDQLLAGHPGAATIFVVIDPAGRVSGTKVLEASEPAFADAAVAALDAWKFKPATQKGQPCFAAFRMVYAFDPEGGRKGLPLPAGARDVLAELRRKEPRVAEFSQLDQPPRHISRRPPTYPSALREQGVNGSAVVEFLIDEQGDAQLPHVVSATAPEFGFAAAQAVAGWRFERPLKGGKAVIARVRVPIEFRLREGGGK